MSDYISGTCPLCSRTLGLTKRQWAFVELVLKGLSDKAIASSQDVTLRAAKCMLARIRTQLGLNGCTRGELILKFSELQKKREALK